MLCPLPTAAALGRAGDATANGFDAFDAGVAVCCTLSRAASFAAAALASISFLEDVDLAKRQCIKYDVGRQNDKYLANH